MNVNRLSMQQVSNMRTESSKNPKSSSNQLSSAAGAQIFGSFADTFFALVRSSALFLRVLKID